MGPGRDRTRDPWICICKQTRFRLRYEQNFQESNRAQPAHREPLYKYWFLIVLTSWQTFRFTAFKLPFVEAYFRIYGYKISFTATFRPEIRHMATSFLQHKFNFIEQNPINRAYNFCRMLFKAFYNAQMLSTISVRPPGGSVLPWSLKIMHWSPQIPEWKFLSSLKVFFLCSPNP